MSVQFSPELICPSCQQSHHVFDAEKALMYVCGNCYAVIEVGPRAIHSSYTLHRPKRTPLLRTGMRGVLKEHAYTIITVAERYETNTDYYWFEYTLMRDHDRKLAFLSTYDSHWNFLEPLSGADLPKPASNGDVTGLSWQGGFFERFSKYRAKYNYIDGELHWQSNLRKGLDCVEYICPPRLLAVETNPYDQREKDYFGGTYTLPEEVSNAFLNGAAMPPRIGIAPAQPAKGIDPQRFLKGTLVFCVLALVIQIMYAFNSKKVPVFNERIYMDTSNVNKPVISPSFKLEGGTSNMEVQLETDVDNSWCEVEVNLVNEQSGKETAFVIGAEYYSGVSDGERWSEGDRMQKEFVCSVPAGTYHFVTTFSKDTNGPPVSIGLTAWWDVPSLWNAVLLSIVMALVAIVIWAIRRSFESRRWEGSNL
ncbi:DUF4178 domain-containing protein [Chitinophaga varians]|uniref:DUF4178 domain-containing protein n=1 Tax=Chitinophaga varians TaxID=2202339 RepID=UPI00165EFB84|nr:DUF4178 domain-containing protein [Chitinophaga varians]MBC9914272.1 DUF4178 domain-containing protein [Chitinophaga varians]